MEKAPEAIQKDDLKLESKNHIGEITSIFKSFKEKLMQYNANKAELIASDHTDSWRLAFYAKKSFLSPRVNMVDVYIDFSEQTCQGIFVNLIPYETFTRRFSKNNDEQEKFIELLKSIIVDQISPCTVEITATNKSLVRFY